MDYITAQKNVVVVKQMIEVYKLSGNNVSPLEVSDSEMRTLWDNQDALLEQILRNCTLEDLQSIYAIQSIGYHERGVRHRYLDNGNEIIEMIEMEVIEDEEQLLNKHSKYIAFLSKQELRDHLLSRIEMSQDLIEGMKILKLS